MEFPLFLDFSARLGIYIFLPWQRRNATSRYKQFSFTSKKGGWGMRREWCCRSQVNVMEQHFVFWFLNIQFVFVFCFFSVNRRKAVPVLMGGMSMAIRSFRWTHPPLPQTHGSQTVQVRSLRAQFLALRSLGPPPQTSSMKKDATLFGCFCTLRLCVFLSFC